MKLSDLKAGDQIVLDNGFTCRSPGRAEVKVDDKGSLYFDCAGRERRVSGSGQEIPAEFLTKKHHLDGQIGDDGELVGIAPAPQTAAAQ